MAQRLYVPQESAAVGGWGAPPGGNRREKNFPESEMRWKHSVCQRDNHALLCAAQATTMEV